MRIAVTGASGFIGGYVLSEMARRNWDVVATSRDGHAPEGTPASVRWVALDLHQPTPGDFERIGQPDVLVHLAWAGLPHYRSLHHFDKELPAQYSFLSGLVRQGLAAMVVAGTCFEYGFQSGPLAPSLETRPANPYGFAKDCLRRQLQFLQATHAYGLTWARLFYVYGPGQASGSLYPLIREAVARGDRVFPMSGGEQLRDYIHVRDVACRLADLATVCRSGTVPDIVNVGTGRPVSVRALVEGWIRENGWSLELQLGRYPYPDYEPMAFWGAPSEGNEDGRHA